MRLAIIPARGGSKRLPRKNIRQFCGQPMIAWSIAAAQESGLFNAVVVSTDDAEIADLARRLGASVPFMRPAQLADDHTGTGAVVGHAVDWFDQQGQAVTEACCLYATAPFVQAKDLREGLGKLQATGCDYVFSATSFAFPIQRALQITENGGVVMLQPEHRHTRSQDLPEAFHDAGQFYWGTADAWRCGRPVFGTSSRPHLLPRHRVQDIDTPEDWQRAEWLFKAQQAQHLNDNGRRHA